MNVYFKEFNKSFVLNVIISMITMNFVFKKNYLEMIWIL